MADERNIVVPVLAQVDEASSVKSIEGFVKKAQPILQNAFTFNPKTILSEYKNYWKKVSSDIRNQVNKPLLPKIDQASLAPLRKQVETSFKTRSKLGMSSNLKIFSNLKDVQSEISRIQNLKSSDFTLEKYDHAMIQEELDLLKRRENSFISAESKINKSLEKNFTEREKAKAQLQEEIKKLDELKAKYVSLKTEIDRKTEDGEDVSSKEKGQLTRQLSKINAQDIEVRKAQANLDKLTNTKKLTKFGKFWNRFNSYLNVRLLRNFFSTIERGFSESLKSISQVDDGINQSMSQITSSFSIISSSIVSMIGPVLETLVPIIQQISTSIANVANGFNQASAKAKGLSTYTKINTEYMKDFASEANSATLSFDKFESLSGGDSLAGMYEKGDVSEDLTGDASEFGVEMYDALTSILEIVKQIWDIVSPLIESVIGLINPILNIVNLLLTLLKPALSSIFDVIGGVIDSFSGAFDIISGILYILTGDFDKAWDHIGLGFKKMAQGMINQFIGLINLIIDAINLLVIKLSPVTWLLNLVGVDTSKMQIPHIPLVTLYKNGGIAERGDLFVANEAGPELVYSGPNNSSSIMNIAQFKQAMVEAIYECSDVFQNADGDVVLRLDGAEIARSKRFKSELNRTNAGLNLI